MGCSLEWNAAELSWDCPCHGSRFATDGRVLNAPAVEPLRGVEVTNSGF
jgi:Rieske Fe-S protein